MTHEQVFSSILTLFPKAATLGILANLYSTLPYHYLMTFQAAIFSPAWGLGASAKIRDIIE